MTFTELKEALALLQGVVVPILGYGIYLLTDIRNQLRTLNGRVTRLEAWTSSHEKLDDERTEIIREQIRDCPARGENHS